MNNGPLMALEPADRVEAAARAIGWIATRAEDIGCSVGLYNHGGWFGDPDNQIAILERVTNKNVGIVFNFHHGHEEIDEFGPLFARMKPHLYAVNLNGMKEDGPMILPLGEGDQELEMMKIIRSSGYSGPVGILDHRNELDAEKSLRQNLEGLKNLLGTMGDTAALATYNGN
jgi:sugar phosphate isomerase/epimerase